MSEDAKFLQLEEVDEASFDNFYDQIQDYSDGEGEDGTIVPPDTRVHARQWAMAYLKLDDEIKYLKGEYIPHLEERYIKPVKDKIEKHQEAQEKIKVGLRTFLENVEETKVNFPDVGTVFVKNAAEKIVYPDDEKEFANSLAKKDSEFVRTEFKIDKTKIKNAYKESGKLPLEDLSVEQGIAQVQLRRAKN